MMEAQGQSAPHILLYAHAAIRLSGKVGWRAGARCQQPIRVGAKSC